MNETLYIFLEGREKGWFENGQAMRGVHLNRFFSPASAGLFLLPFLVLSKKNFKKTY